MMENLFFLVVVWIRLLDCVCGSGAWWGCGFGSGLVGREGGVGGEMGLESEGGRGEGDGVGEGEGEGRGSEWLIGLVMCGVSGWLVFVMEETRTVWFVGDRDAEGVWVGGC